MNVKALVGSGDKIMSAAAPFLAIGLALNLWRPSLFGVGGPPKALKALSALALIPGVVGWLWSVALVLTKVPKGELIAHGPYSVVKHPLYTSVGLLVLPSVGFLLNTWLGGLVGVVLYAASRRFAPEEDRALSETFGAAWDEYSRGVKLPWL